MHKSRENISMLTAMTRKNGAWTPAYWNRGPPTAYPTIKREINITWVEKIFAIWTLSSMWEHLRGILFVKCLFYMNFLQKINWEYNSLWRETFSRTCRLIGSSSLNGEGCGRNGFWFKFSYFSTTDTNKYLICRWIILCNKTKDRGFFHSPTAMCACGTCMHKQALVGVCTRMIACAKIIREPLGYQYLPASPTANPVKALLMYFACSPASVTVAASRAIPISSLKRTGKLNFSWVIWWEQEPRLDDMWEASMTETIWELGGKEATWILVLRLNCRLNFKYWELSISPP